MDLNQLVVTVVLVAEVVELDIVLVMREELQYLVKEILVEHLFIQILLLLAAEVAEVKVVLEETVVINLAEVAVRQQVHIQLGLQQLLLELAVLTQAEVAEVVIMQLQAEVEEVQVMDQVE